jgi:hypothetical protein
MGMSHSALVVGSLAVGGATQAGTAWADALFIRKGGHT